MAISDDEAEELAEKEGHEHREDREGEGVLEPLGDFADDSPGVVVAEGAEVEGQHPAEIPGEAGLEKGSDFLFRGELEVVVSLILLIPSF